MNNKLPTVLTSTKRDAPVVGRKKYGSMWLIMVGSILMRSILPPAEVQIL